MTTRDIPTCAAADELAAPAALEDFAATWASDARRR
jgi:hypothetical protein